MEETSYDEEGYTWPWGESWGESSWHGEDWWWTDDDWRVFLARIIVDYTGQPSLGCPVAVVNTTALAGTGGIALCTGFSGSLIVDRNHMVRGERSRLPSPPCKAYSMAAIFSVTTILRIGFQRRKGLQNLNMVQTNNITMETLQGYLAHAKGDFRDNPMRIMSDTCATISLCCFWSGENVPLTGTTQKVTSASGADLEIYGWRTVPLIFKEIPGCCFVATFLVCDAIAPGLPVSQLLQ